MQCQAVINLGPHVATYCQKPLGHKGDHEGKDYSKPQEPEVRELQRSAQTAFLKIRSTDGVELSGVVEITKAECSILGMKFPTNEIEIALREVLTRVEMVKG